MIGWIVGKTSSSGTRGTAIRLCFVTTHASDRPSRCGGAGWRGPRSRRHLSPGRRSSARVAGEREEHVVQRRPAQRDVGHLDLLASSRRTASRARAPTLHGHGSPWPPWASTCTSPSAIGCSAWAASDAALAGRGGDLDALAAHARLELVGRALLDHAPLVDDRDVVGQPVGLLEVLGGEQHAWRRGRRAARSCPTSPAGCAGPGPWSARRGRPPAGSPPAPQPGPAVGACRRSRS